MKHLIHEPRRLVAATVLALLVLSLVGAPSSAAPLQQGTIYRVYITDVRDNQFVVSWTTQTACTASLNYGTTGSLGTPVSDVLNPTTSTTHYITVTALSPSTTYYFDTTSGATVDNNGGPHYTVTTGPSIAALPPSPRTVGGNVYYNGTTTGVPGAIVYLRLTQGGVDSQLVAVRTDSSGTIGLWRYVIANLRTADNTAYFPWVTGNTITVIAQGGVAGNGQLITTVPAGSGPIGNITLDGTPTAISLASFGARSSGMNVALPLVAFGLLGGLGLLAWRRRQTAR